jgi:hypothetical protein
MATTGKTSARNTTARKATARKSSSNRKTDPKAARKVATVMHEFKEGTLRSSSGDKVTNPQQAVAIGLSEAREASAKVPARGKR